MKICKDCKYYVPPTIFGVQYHMCKRPGCVNEVTGEPTGFCESQRLHDHLCGQEAKFFLLKESKRKK